MNARAAFLRRLLDGTYLGAALLAAACLAAIGALTLAQVAGRWFGVLVPAAEDFAGYLMAASTFLALAWTLRSGGHIRVNLLIRRFPDRARRWQELAACGAMLVLCAWLTWSCFAFVHESFVFGDVSSGYVAVPLWIPQLPMALGLAMLSLALLDAFVAIARGRIPVWQQEENNAA